MQKSTKKATRYAELIEKCKSGGFGALTENEAAELFLCFAEYTNDASVLYEKLQDGDDPCSYFELTKDTLTKNRVSEKGAYLIADFPEIANRCLDSTSPDRRTLIRSRQDTAIRYEALKKVMQNRFLGAKEEKVMLLLLDEYGRVIYTDFVVQGSNDAVSINITKICSIAALKMADSAVIAHNHPSGSPVPSRADCEVTMKLAQALKAVGVVLLDHLIVTRRECESIRKFYDFYNTDLNYLRLVSSRLDYKEYSRKNRT